MAQPVNVDGLTDRDDRCLPEQAEPKIVVLGPRVIPVAADSFDYRVSREHSAVDKNVAPEETGSKWLVANGGRLNATMVSLFVDEDRGAETCCCVCMGLQCIDQSVQSVGQPSIVGITPSDISSTGIAQTSVQAVHYSGPGVRNPRDALSKLLHDTARAVDRSVVDNDEFVVRR